MHPTTIDLMNDEVRAIYRALTGADLPESDAEATQAEVPVEEVARRLADLEERARHTPSLTDQVRMFAFAPPIDAREQESELVIEVAVPGIDLEDVSAECSNDTLLITGIRRARPVAEGAYFHTEIPSGPFYRIVKLPFAFSAEPRVELDRGLIVIHLSKPEASPEEAPDPASQPH